MDTYFEALHKYCERFSSSPGELLKELERETHLKTLSPRMMSGPLQGAFLSMVSQMLQPQTILEIGTFTGYATLCLAKGLKTGGELHTIEVNPELAYIIEKYVGLADVSESVKLHLGKAEEIIPDIPGNFDLVFLDAGKKDYALHYDLVIDRIPSGGIILADNLLWSGKVLSEPHDKTTAIIHAFNEKIAQDERVEQVLLPIRDGLMMARKK